MQSIAPAPHSVGMNNQVRIPSSYIRMVAYYPILSHPILSPPVTYIYTFTYIHIHTHTVPHTTTLSPFISHVQPSPQIGKLTLLLFYPYLPFTHTMTFAPLTASHHFFPFLSFVPPGKGSS